MAAARVLYLITDLDRGGGAEQHLLTLVQHLNRARFVPELAYLIGKGQLAEAFEAADCRVHALHARYRGDPFALWRLLRLLELGHYDLVHTHLPRADAYGAMACYMGESLARARVALSGASRGSRTRNPVDSGELAPALVSTKHNDDRFYFHPLVRVVAAMVARRADALIAISRHLANFLRAQRLVPPFTPIRHIYYGLRPPDWEHESFDAGAIRARLGIETDELMLFAAGRLTRQKGHEHLVAAMASLRDHAPRARLIIAGRGELHGLLAGQIARLGLADRVQLLGLRPDVPTLMRAADIVVMPSLWEGFGLVLLEAMQAERPVVATTVGAIPEVVEHGITGLLVPPGDSAALARALATLCRDGDTRGRMGQAGAARLKEFSIRRMVSETEGLYAEVLASHPRRKRASRIGGPASPSLPPPGVALPPRATHP